MADLESLSEIGKNALYFGGGIITAILGYGAYAMYALGKTEQDCKYKRLVNDYRERIFELPTEDKIRIFQIYHSEGALKETPTAENLPAIEGKLQKEIQKRRMEDMRGVPICSLSEENNKDNLLRLDIAEKQRCKSKKPYVN